MRGENSQFGKTAPLLKKDKTGSLSHAESNEPLSEVCLPGPEGFRARLSAESGEASQACPSPSFASFLLPNFSGTMETKAAHLDDVFLVVLCYLTVHLPRIPCGK